MTTIKPFDPTKPVQTRDGRKARIVCTDMDHSSWGLTGVAVHTSLPIRQREGTEEVLFFDITTGRAKGNTVERPYDLVNVPVRTSTWENMYKDTSGGSLYHDKETASLSSSNFCKRWGRERIGYLRRDYEDGVFVSAEFEPLTSE